MLRTADAIALIETTEAIVTTDPANVITGWSRGAERLYGYTAAELVGQPMGTVAEHELGWPRATLEELRARLRDTGRGRAVHRARRKDGRRIWVEAVVFALHDDDDRPAGHIGIVRHVDPPIPVDGGDPVLSPIAQEKLGNSEHAPLHAGILSQAGGSQDGYTDRRLRAAMTVTNPPDRLDRALAAHGIGPLDFEEWTDADRDTVAAALERVDRLKRDRKAWARFERGRRIKTARETAGLKQRDVASALGVSEKYISRWETGNRTPDDEHLRMLADVLKVPRAHLRPEDEL